MNPMNRHFSIERYFDGSKTWSTVAAFQFEGSRPASSAENGQERFDELVREHPDWVLRLIAVHRHHDAASKTNYSGY